MDTLLYILSLMNLSNVYERYRMIMAVQVSLTQARIDMSELDEDSDGFLQFHVWILISVRLPIV
jgi:hypothetical protein